MEYSKLLNFGNIKIKINSKTQFEIRKATLEEKNKYSERIFGVPFEPQFNSQFWVKVLCRKCNIPYNAPIINKYMETVNPNLKFGRFSFVKLRLSDKFQEKKTATIWASKSVFSKELPIGELYYPKDFLLMFYAAYNHFKDIENRYRYNDFNITDAENLSYIKALNAHVTKKDAMLQSEEYKTYMEKEITVLVIDDNLFFDGYCDFDIYSKYTEVKNAFDELNESHQRKLQNSNNVGEKEVDYAIEWFIASSNTSIISIKNDCESNYRYNCIYISNPSFRPEAQEYDHILITPSGVICIETKHWQGHIEIRNDGKWLRQNDNGMVGVESPIFQIKRHELLLKSFLPDTPIYSILCFSNSSAVIDGKDFVDYCPIVYVDHLDEYLNSIVAEHILDETQMKNIATIIENHKINKC